MDELTAHELQQLDARLSKLEEWAHRPVDTKPLFENLNRRIAALEAQFVARNITKQKEY